MPETQVLKVECLYQSLGTVAEAWKQLAYAKSIRPLDLEFSVSPGEAYALCGLKIRDGLIWFYVLESNDADYPLLAPSDLFAPAPLAIPGGWVLTAEATTCGCVYEIVPSDFAEIPCWYERLIEGAPDVTEKFFEVRDRILTSRR